MGRSIFWVFNFAVAQTHPMLALPYTHSLSQPCQNERGNSDREEAGSEQDAGSSARFCSHPIWDAEHLLTRLLSLFYSPAAAAASGSCRYERVAHYFL